MVDLGNSRFLRQVVALKTDSLFLLQISHVLHAQTFYMYLICLGSVERCLWVANIFFLQLDDEDSILPHKLQAALEQVLEKRRELACEKGDLHNGDSSPHY